MATASLEVRWPRSRARVLLVAAIVCGVEGAACGEQGLLAARRDELPIRS
jgi:hypothetical protein